MDDGVLCHFTVRHRSDKSIIVRKRIFFNGEQNLLNHFLIAWRAGRFK